MKLSVDFGSPRLDWDTVERVTPTDLNDFYASASEVDRLNLFFVLLNTLNDDAAHAPVREAHLCFLLAYYLFVPLTPPGSASLALHYIRRAIALDPKAEYREWLALIERGN